MIGFNIIKTKILYLAEKKEREKELPRNFVFFLKSIFYNNYFE